MREWPVLRRHEAETSLQVAMPIGGIGTGTVSLGGRGDLRDWELVNRPAKGWSPAWSFFAIRTASAGGRVAARVLEGPIDPVHYGGPHGSPVPNHGLPRFRRSQFLAAYPLGQVLLDDPHLPVTVRLQAFNPLIPADADASGIPIAGLRYVVTNPAGEPVEVSVAGSLQNFVGTDGSAGKPSANRNVARSEAPVTGVFLTTAGVDPAAEQWGSLALAVIDETGVSVRTAWANHIWGELLDFWDDFTADGRLDERTNPGDAPIASVAASRTLPPGGSHAFTFVLAWHFPNRRSWDGQHTVGNHYATRYPDAWRVLTTVAPMLPELERRTVEFVSAFVGSDLPDVVKDAALANLCTLRTQTCFRAVDGRMFGWEGCNDTSGSCHGSCTHVWNYELVTPFLFGELACSMREVELRFGTADDGLMSFRVQLPLERGCEMRIAAADGQLGALVKLYREWRLSGDDALLRSLWPTARKALEFAWIPGGWDADRDGVMEGAQHNTMDVEYFGPNPQVGGWYLAALRACEEMARHLGEHDFAETCGALFRRGSSWLDAHLFNGEYYRHEIRPPGTADAIAPGLRLPGIGARDLVDPELQVGDGCLADQLVGQLMAHLTGLGYLLNPGQVTTALRNVLRYNQRGHEASRSIPLRSYALGDEPGLVVASYPHGNRPARPFPYFAEVWTGLEYVAAVGMVYEGMVDEGLRVIEAVRGRYDGRRRNPFDEAECGHHYVRAMASWGAVPALTGFGYDGVTATLRFAAAARPARWFWSNGYAWGTVAQRPSTDAVSVDLNVCGGQLRLRELVLDGLGAACVGDRTLREGDRLEIDFSEGKADGADRRTHHV